MFAYEFAGGSFIGFAAGKAFIGWVSPARPRAFPRAPRPCTSGADGLHSQIGILKRVANQHNPKNQLWRDNNNARKPGSVLLFRMLIALGRAGRGCCASHFSSQ
jgi:hypothetical protein